MFYAFNAEQLNIITSVAVITHSITVNELEVDLCHNKLNDFQVTKTQHLNVYQFG